MTHCRHTMMPWHMAGTPWHIAGTPWQRDTLQAHHDTLQAHHDNVTHCRHTMTSWQRDTLQAHHDAMTHGRHTMTHCRHTMTTWHMAGTPWRHDNVTHGRPAHVLTTWRSWDWCHQDRHWEDCCGSWRGDSWHATQPSEGLYRMTQSKTGPLVHHARTSRYVLHRYQETFHFQNISIYPSHFLKHRKYEDTAPLKTF